MRGNNKINAWIPKLSRHPNESHKLKSKRKKKKKTTIQLARIFTPSICYVKQVMLMCHVMPVHFINIIIIGMHSLVSLFHANNGSNHRQRQHVFLMWFNGFIWLPPYTGFFIDTLNGAFNHAQSSCKINFHRVVLTETYVAGTSAMQLVSSFRYLRFWR